MDRITEPRLNMEKKGRNFFIKGLGDNKLHPMHSPSPDHCLQPVHTRLSCQACHSTWVPQCYGCHVQYNLAGKQLDKISGRESPGRWTEFKSIVRFSSPPLAVLASEDAGKHANRITMAETSARIVVVVPG